MIGRFGHWGAGIEGSGIGRSRIGGLGDQRTAYRVVELLGIGESGVQRLRDGASGIGVSGIGFRVSGDWKIGDCGNGGSGIGASGMARLDDWESEIRISVDRGWSIG